LALRLAPNTTLRDVTGRTGLDLRRRGKGCKTYTTERHDTARDYPRRITKPMLQITRLEMAATYSITSIGEFLSRDQCPLLGQERARVVFIGCVPRCRRHAIAKRLRSLTGSHRLLD
jgi:hypothetical protein